MTWLIYAVEHIYSPAAQHPTNVYRWRRQFVVRDVWSGNRGGSGGGAGGVRTHPPVAIWLGASPAR